jgi:hypothetical protein
MYLNNIELKAQDLGLLQQMDNTQYSRYRDTVNDWYNDRNFAYGVYQDDVQQGNWQTNFDYNALVDNRNYNNNEYWNNKNFENNNYWANKDEEWKNKEWNESLADKQYDREQAEKQAAQNNVWNIANTGVMPNDALIEASGLDKTVVQNYANERKTQIAKSLSGGGGGGSSYTSSSSSGPDYKAMQWDVEMEDRARNWVMDLLSQGIKPSAADLNAAGITYEQAFGIMGNYGYGPLADTSTSSTTSSTPTSNTPTSSTTQYNIGNYSAVLGAMQELTTTQGKDVALNYLNDAFESGLIDIPSYNTLKSSFGG